MRFDLLGKEYTSDSVEEYQLYSAVTGRRYICRKSLSGIQTKKTFAAPLEVRRQYELASGGGESFLSIHWPMLSIVEVRSRLST
jgi:hypothetical protein